ncbi:triacylglycerol lipase OBL1 isoform X2 [Spinacia oleracea]|nr:triacylglycerol lipase OBL1-like isoform X2 [Spinacia oleracea]
MELNKDIKHGDARYYPALSMMASKLVYENEHVIQTIVSRLWKMEHVKFYDCYNDYQKKRTTEAFIMREETEEDDKIIVAFRGTSPFDADDWSTDFDYSWCNIHGMGKTHMGFMVALGLKRYNNYDDNENINCDFPKQIEQDPERPLAYYVIRDKLKEIMANNNNNKNKRVKFIMTGHSLGGALAILFPALLALHGEVDLLNNLEVVYTFGQPRVGNEQFGQFMKIILREHKIKYYRIVYGYDIVPTVPLDNTFMTFKHFGTSIHFNALYRGKIVEEEQQKAVKKGVKKYLKNLRGIVMITMECILARLTALLEFIRGFIIGFIAGPYYREGWLLICFRSFGILFPGVVNHNPQDYVNATTFASPDLFEYHPATNT